MPAGVIEAKTALRQEIANKPRPNWDPMIRAFERLPELERADTVLLFYGVRKEPDTRTLISRLLEQGKTVALPRCLPGRQMEARAVTDLEHLKLSAFSIPEPDDFCPVVEKEKIDLVLVPNLCCDRHGYRLGHGAGYYDRYLAGYAGVTVSLCPEDWLQESVPRSEMDVPVKLVLTEAKAWRGVETPRQTSEGFSNAR